MAQSAGNVMLRGQFTDLFESRLPFLDEILFENFDAPSLTYPKVFNVRDSVRAYEEITGITGFAQFTKKTEGAKLEYDALLQAYDKRFTHETWAKGYQISFEAMEDDLDGAITDAGPALARIARNSIETEVFSTINGAFSATTTPDGQALCSDSHQLVGGGTFDNLQTGDFSQSVLEAMINSYSDMRDERNQLIEMEPRLLLGHPDLQWIFGEVLQSELRSDTANNATNVVQTNRIGIQPVYSKYLTDKDSFFVMSEPSRHRIIVYWRREPFSDSSLDFDTRNMKTAMFYRLSHGAADWRGIVGSQGV
jgi:hypothetical protein